jgi:phage terminase large subunit
MIVDFPRKLSPLFVPMRFKSIRGGRDGGKSWGVARALLELGATRKMLVVCARETMESIKDSVHRLLSEQIDALGMGGQYGIEKSLIWHKTTGTEFVFRGLKNPDALKSLEGADIAWIEEAQSVSDDSWRKLIPTVRKDNSEIWLTWNPELESDPTWKRFVLKPPPGMVEILMNFSDNPWASEVLREEREQLEAEDPDEYAHVWLGQPRRMTRGGIYGAQMRLMEEQGRITQVKYDASIPVDTAWDLGKRDFTAIWFIQRVMGQYKLIDYYENRHQPLEHYLSVMEGRGYKYGVDFWPWDAGSDVLVNSLSAAMRQRGRNVKILPRQSREAGIDKVRTMLGTCWADAERCEMGLQRLRYYRYENTSKIDPVTGNQIMTMEPIHDDNCFDPNTLIVTRYGIKRIIDVGTNEEVLTPCGFKACLPARWTQRNAPLVEVLFADGNTVRCTPEHLFLTDSGWKSAESLTSTSLIQSSLTLQRRILMGIYSGFIRGKRIFQEVRDVYTDWFGNAHLAQFLSVATSTTGTATQETTDWIISNVSLSQNTASYLVAKKPSINSVIPPGKRHVNGINLKKVGCGTDATRRLFNHGKRWLELKSPVNVAALKSMLSCVLSSRKNTVPIFAKHLRIVSVKNLQERIDTCCINVPDGHWFTLANGAVVHNSHGSDALRSAAMGFSLPVGNPPPPPDKWKRTPPPRRSSSSYTPFA